MIAVANLLLGGFLFILTATQAFPAAGGLLDWRDRAYFCTDGIGSFSLFVSGVLLLQKQHLRIASRWQWLGFACLAVTAAISWTERFRVENPAGPDGLLDFLVFIFSVGLALLGLTGAVALQWQVWRFVACTEPRRRVL